MSDSSTPTSGLGFGGALFILFLALKLTDVIDWSWWWITAPLWGGFALVVGFIAVAGAVALVLSLIVLIWEKMID